MGPQDKWLRSPSTNDSRWLDAERIYPYALVGIIALALGLRLLGLNKGIWLDEFSTLRWIFSGNLLQMLRQMRDTWPPLYFILLKPWSQIGNNEVFLRLFSVFFGVGLVITAMQWMKRYSYLSSILAGIILTTLPIMLRDSQEIRGYSLLLFVEALSFYYASLLIAEPRRIAGYLGLSISLTLAVSTHMIGVMLILPVWIFIITMIPGKKSIELRKAFLTLVIPGMMFVYFYYFFLERGRLKDWWMPPISLDLLSCIANYLQDSLTSAWPLRMIHEKNPVLGIYGGYLVALIVLVLALIPLVFGEWRGSLPFFLAAMIYWGQLLIYSLIVLPIIWERSLLPGLVPFIGFISLQLATIKRKMTKTIYLGVIILLSLTSTASWVTHGAWEPVEKWREISKILKTNWQPHDLVVFYPGFASRPVEYYFPGLPAQSIVKVARRTSREQVFAEIRNKMSGSGRGIKAHTVFLIVRMGIPLINDLKTYHNIIIVLKNMMHKPAVFHVLIEFSSHINIPKGLIATRREFLAYLTANFGPPLFFHDLGNAYWLQYEPPS